MVDHAVQGANSELMDEITAVADDVKDVVASMGKMDTRLSSKMDNFDQRLKDKQGQTATCDEQATKTGDRHQGGH